MNKKFVRGAGVAAGLMLALANPINKVDAIDLIPYHYTHTTIPLTGVVQDFYISEIDFTNHEFELTYTDAHANGKELKRISVYHYTEGNLYDVDWKRVVDPDEVPDWGVRYYRADKDDGTMPEWEDAGDGYVKARVAMESDDLWEENADRMLVIMIAFEEEQYWSTFFSYGGCETDNNKETWEAGTTCKVWFYAGGDIEAVWYMTSAIEGWEEPVAPVTPEEPEEPEDPEDPEEPEGPEEPEEPEEPEDPDEPAMPEGSEEPGEDEETEEQPEEQPEELPSVDEVGGGQEVPEDEVDIEAPGASPTDPVEIGKAEEIEGNETPEEDEKPNATNTASGNNVSNTTNVTNAANTANGNNVENVANAANAANESSAASATDATNTVSAANAANAADDTEDTEDTDEIDGDDDLDDENEEASAEVGDAISVEDATEESNMDVNIPDLGGCENNGSNVAYSMIGFVAGLITGGFGVWFLTTFFKSNKEQNSSSKERK